MRTPPKKKFRLAIVSSHVIHSANALYRKLSDHPDIELTLLFCSDHGLFPRFTDVGFKIKFQWDTINLDRMNYKFLSNYALLPSLTTFFGLFNPGIFWELRRKRYDAVLVVGYGLFSYWIAFISSVLTRTPYFLTGEPPASRRSRLRIVVMTFLKYFIIPPLLEFAAGVFYIGSQSKAFYLRYNTRVRRKLYFFPYSVDNEYYLERAKAYAGKKTELRQELGIPDGYPVILFLSKLIKWKRPLLLLEAFRDLKTPATLVFVGSGHREHVLQEYIRAHNLERVRLFGFQNYSQVPKFYSAADIFVLPSLGESWGLAINEAMCFGLPIITTRNVSAAHDLIVDGENGFVIDRENRPQLTDRLEYLVSHPEECRQMGARSSQMIRGWNYAVCVASVIEALNKIGAR